MDIDIDGVKESSRMFETAKDAVAEVEWVIGTNVHYSVYVEFGTSKMAAQPYLRPALRRARTQADAVLAANDGDIEATCRELALMIEAEAKRLCPVDTGKLRASIKAERVS